MFPLPFKKFMPKAYQDLINKGKAPSMDAMEKKWTINITSWRDTLHRLKTLWSIEKCPDGLLDELGSKYNAGIRPADSPQTKRQKIKNAVPNHKKRALFDTDVKITIDRTAGGDSKLIKLDDDTDSSGWLLKGDGSFVSTNDEGLLGGDLSFPQSLYLGGSGMDIEDPGNIFIDVDNPALTADELNTIVEDMFATGVVPAYFIVHLGFISGGNFVEYIALI